jgi:Domain of unknown function (DUF6265)
MRDLFIIALLALTANGAGAVDRRAALPGWLSGMWSKTDGAKWAEEHWLPPRGALMLGSSRSGTGEETGFWEHMRIEREADGSVAFWAISGDQKPVRFVATQIGHHSITFENAAHDFPQRIRYWRVGKRLHAEISMIDGNKPVQFSFLRKWD